MKLLLLSVILLSINSFAGINAIQAEVDFDEIMTAQGKALDAIPADKTNKEDTRSTAGRGQCA